MKRLNRNISLIALFIIILLLFSLNINDLGNKSNFGSYIGIVVLLAFILIKSKK